MKTGKLFGAIQALILGAALVWGVLWASDALAGEAELTWVNPTQRVDGSALPAGELRGTRIEYGTCGSDLPLEALAPAGATGLTISDLAPGEWCFTARARASGAGSEILESDPTAPVSKVIAPSPPAPPSGLTVSASVAYNVVKVEDRFVLLPVGTVPAGTPCDVTQTVNGHYAVPRSQVSWSGDIQPDVVVARCS